MEAEKRIDNTSDIEHSKQKNDTPINKWETPSMHVFSVKKTLSGEVPNTSEDYSGS